MLVRLIDAIPVPAQRGRGHPRVYSDRLFRKALMIMIVRHLTTVHELRAVLDQPTAEMQTLRMLLTKQPIWAGSAPGSAARARSAAWAGT